MHINTKIIIYLVFWEIRVVKQWKTRDLSKNNEFLEVLFGNFSSNDPFRWRHLLSFSSLNPYPCSISQPEVKLETGSKIRNRKYVQKMRNRSWIILMTTICVRSTNRSSVFFDSLRIFSPKSWFILDLNRVSRTTRPPDCSGFSVRSFTLKFFWYLAVQSGPSSPRTSASDDSVPGPTVSGA